MSLDSKEYKGILETKAQQLEEEEHNQPKSDEELIKEALVQVEKFNGATHISGDPVLTPGFLTGYTLQVQIGGVENKNAFAFVYPKITTQVLDFLVNAAKQDDLIEVFHVGDSVTIVKEYKPIGD